MKDVQCYELFRGIALKNPAFSFFNEVLKILLNVGRLQKLWKIHYLLISNFSLNLNEKFKKAGT